MATLNIKHEAAYTTIDQWRWGLEPDASQLIQPGEQVEYLGHVVGGMVKVEHAGQPVIIHPGATIELGN